MAEETSNKGYQNLDSHLLSRRPFLACNCPAIEKILEVSNWANTVQNILLLNNESASVDQARQRPFRAWDNTSNL